MTPEAPPGRRRGRGFRLIVAALVSVAAVGVLALGIERARIAGSAERGERAPAFDLETYRGGRVRLADHAGKVVMIDFWASWCGPCKEEMPALVKVAKELAPRGLVFVAANSGELLEDKQWAVDTFIAETDPALADYVAYATEEMSRAYGILALPTLVLVDREGRIAGSWRGKMSEAQLRQRLEEVLD